MRSLVKTWTMASRQTPEVYGTSQGVRPSDLSGDALTSSQDCRLSCAIIVLIRLVRKLKCVSSLSNVHIHPMDTWARSVLPGYRSDHNSNSSSYTLTFDLSIQ